MAKGIVALTVLLLSAASYAAEAPIPKTGNFTGRNVLSGTVKAMPLGKDRIQLTYEVMGIYMSDTGEGPLHNSSMRCMGGLHAANGSFDDESGSCVYTRPDGDQAFARYKAAGKVGVEAKGSGTFVGGTGKLTGMQGTFEFTRTNARPAAEGTSQSLVRSKTSYQLP